LKGAQTAPRIAALGRTGGNPVIRDLLAALRGLARARGLTLAALLTLGLGIGAATLVFGVVDGLVLRPLPFGDRTARLVTLHSTHPTQATDWDDSEISLRDLRDLRTEAGSFADIQAFFDRNFSVAGVEETERVLGASVTPGLFALLGVEPRLGRGFRPEDGGDPGHESVALLSHALWTRRFAADPDIVGRAVRLNGRAVTVAGIMPEGFRFPEHHDLWLPYDPVEDPGRDRRGLLGIGLLRPGVALEAAAQEASAVAARLAARHPETNRGWGLHLLPIHRFYVEDGTRRALTAMLGAVLLVLLVACANVAGLLLVRGIARQEELTVRAALGAGRGRLVRLLMVESLLLAIGGAGLGLLLASWGLGALIASNPEPPPYWAQLAVDGRTLLFVAAIALLATVACGLVPALRVSRLDLRRGMAAGRGGAAGREQRRAQGALVAAQIAAGLVLLVSAALLTGSASRLDDAYAGFDRHPLLSLRVYLSGDTYDDPAARARAVEQVVARMEALPGAVSAAASGAIPTDDGGDGIRVVPERGPALPGEEIGVQAMPASPGLFATLGLALLEGRTFSAAETVDPRADVVLVNRRLAADFWPAGSAIGRRIGVVTPEGTRWLRVVGVAPDLVYEELGEETPQSQRNVYLPLAVAGWRTMAVLVRASVDPAPLAAAVPRALRDVDPGLAAFDVLTMDQRRLVTHWGERFLGRLFAGFAAAVMLLACVGTYGLMSYAAARRRRELGLRLAVGASSTDLVRLLLGSGVRLAVLGLLVGLPLAGIAARMLQGLLFGLSAWDPGIWLSLPALLLAVVLGACWLPARRASLTPPAVALRQE
jgi:predicted permease